MAVTLIKEARNNGARLWKACEVLEISISTFRRWSAGRLVDCRKGAAKQIPRKLTFEEEQSIIDACCSKEYKDDNPYKIHASLLDKGTYIASISSFYRVLRKKGLISHRGNTRPGQSHSKPPEKIATGPNQVWCWDITWLSSDVRGLFYYAYVIIDIWDRSIVKWAIHDREDDALSEELFQHALRDNEHPDVWIHSDNGNPMKGVTLLALFYSLGICNSYSRPRVSNDNPFIESWFKTLKYNVLYPGKFSSTENAREWFAGFVDSYNTSHSHSGMHFITPQQVRSGQYGSIVANRNKVMIEAKSKNPQRWSRNIKQLPEKHVVTLNPMNLTRITAREKAMVQVA
ncbi:MAG: IS3 family transposase [bacterium]|nr:IS3 family transposase [bacterium]